LGPTLADINRVGSDGISISGNLLLRAGNTQAGGFV
jgi:hypothetical protein